MDSVIHVSILAERCYDNMISDDNYNDHPIRHHNTEVLGCVFA